MKSLTELMELEKKSNADLRYCDYIVDKASEKENTRIRILHDAAEGKYYYHIMQNGNVTNCFEIALSYEPFENVQIFAFTPDDLHICEIDSRAPERLEYKHLRESQIQHGMKCEYDGLTIEFVSDELLKFNEKEIKILPSDEYTYQIRKTFIRAEGEARGLYCFLENIAVDPKHFGSVWWDNFKNRFA